MIKKIDVIKIDQSLLEEIEAAHTELKASSDEVKELHLNLDSGSGDREVAVQAAQVLHSDATIIPVTHSSGEMDTAGTILASAGYVGRRTAEPKSAFVINDGEPYGEDSKPEDLEGLDYFVYDAVSKLTGRKSLVLKKMIEGGSFSSVIAKQCKIIDEITGFKSAFATQKSGPGRGRKKAVNTSTSAVASAPVVSTDGAAVSEAVSTAPKSSPRTRIVKRVETGNVQRGRIGKNG